MRIANAVQPEAWYRALPRPGYANLEKIARSHSWFEVYRLPKSVFALYEPGHFQEVISYLVLGDTRALLIDTGMGIGDMNGLVRELTALPIDVVNTHCHFDHIGCNWQFDRVHIFHERAALERLKGGVGNAELAHHLAGDSTWQPYPQGFDPANYSIPASVPEPIGDGHRFDLGGRLLTAIHAPGHSPDSIMLHDALNEILFTGDTFYPATLYAHLDSQEGVSSDFATYRRTLRAVADQIPAQWLYTSHNEPLVRGETLQRVADVFDDIAGDELDFRLDQHGLRKYQFDGFAVVTRDPPI